MIPQGNMQGTTESIPETGRILLRTTGLSVGYSGRGLPEGRRTVLSGLDLELCAGEMVCLLGPNGAGKSTLLRTLCGLQAPLSGGLEVDGQNASGFAPESWARRAAIVLTERVDGGGLTVQDVAALGRHPHTGWTGRLRAADCAAVENALRDSGAWELRDRIFDRLSDGEKQKALLARALAQEPSLLLLDEPTAFLDLPRRVETLRTLRRMARTRGRAVLLSTHDLDLALRAADKLWLMHPGGPLLSGLPEDLVLSGAFARVFDQGDVVFDPASGEFRIHAPPTRKIRVRADAVLTSWAARALEREGFAATIDAAANSNQPTHSALPGDGADPSLSAVTESKSPADLGLLEGRQSGPDILWTWHAAGQVETFTTLAAVLARLRSFV